MKDNAKPIVVIKAAGRISKDKAEAIMSQVVKTGIQEDYYVLLIEESMELFVVDGKQNYNRSKSDKTE